MVFTNESCFKSPPSNHEQRLETTNSENGNIQQLQPLNEPWMPFSTMKKPRSKSERQLKRTMPPTITQSNDIIPVRRNTWQTNQDDTASSQNEKVKKKKVG